jgi:hypothetical protein
VTADAAKIGVVPWRHAQLRSMPGMPAFFTPIDVELLWCQIFGRRSHDHLQMCSWACEAAAALLVP